MSKARQGKGALITGGSQGRGPVVAVSLADQGTDIAFTYAALSAKAESVLDRVKVEGVRAIAIRCDQADTSGRRRSRRQGESSRSSCFRALWTGYSNTR